MFHCNPWHRHAAYARYAYATHCTPASSFSRRRQQHNVQESRGHRQGSFGVRRPLRYLSHRLDLDDQQRRVLAASFERIKIEREQAALDRKRSDGQVADKLTQQELAVEDLQQAMSPRTDIAQRLQATIAKELYDIVQVLDDEQREEFAYLVRSGVVKL